MDFKTFHEQEAGVDPSLDTLDTADGRAWLYHHDTPDQRFEVVSLLDANGEVIECDDIDEAVELALGGAVKLGEARFKTFVI